MDFLQEIKCQSYLQYNPLLIEHAQVFPVSFMKGIDPANPDGFIHLFACYSSTTTHSWSFLESYKSPPYRICLVIINRPIDTVTEFIPDNPADDAEFLNNMQNVETFGPAWEKFVKGVLTQTQHTQDLFTRWQKLHETVAENNDTLNSLIETLQKKLVRQLAAHDPLTDTTIKELEQAITKEVEYLEDYSRQYLHIKGMVNTAETKAEAQNDFPSNLNEKRLRIMTEHVNELNVLNNNLGRGSGGGGGGGDAKGGGGTTTSMSQYGERTAVTNATGRVMSMSGRIKDDNLNELELNKLTDPLSEFIKLACGSISYNMINAFIMMPDLSNFNTRNPKAVQQFRNTLTATVLNAYEQTDVWIQGLSRYRLSIATIDHIEQRTLFVLTAQICGQFIRESTSNNPQRATIATRHALKDHKEKVNLAILEVEYEIDKYLKRFGERVVSKTLNLKNYI